MKYRKKPVVIEAFKCYQILRQASTHFPSLPKWIKESYEHGNIIFLNQSLIIKTLDGDMTANRYDYIIQGIKGEIYPCKPDIFESTYEKVEE